MVGYRFSNIQANNPHNIPITRPDNNELNPNINTLIILPMRILITKLIFRALKKIMLEKNKVHTKIKVIFVAIETSNRKKGKSSSE